MARKLAASPHCEWCGCLVRAYPYPTPLTGENHTYPPDLATLDHLYDRIEGPRPKQGKWLLACWKCNRERNIKRTKELRPSGKDSSATTA